MKTSQSGDLGVFDMSWFVEQERRIAEASTRRRPFDAGHIYVVEFTSGVVKVGKAGSPKSRVASHAHHARVHGGDVRGSWISERHHGVSVTERDLIAYCKKRGVLAFGKEYFRGVDFDDVRGYASLLACNAGGAVPNRVMA